MTRDSLSLPFSNLDPDILDAKGNIDPKKLAKIQSVMKKHKSQGGEITPALKSAVKLVKGLVTPNSDK